MKIYRKETYFSPSIELLGAETLFEILQTSDNTGEGIGDEMIFGGSDDWSD